MGVKFIEITPDFLTGVEEMDQQHKNIANHINFMATLLSEGQVEEAIDYYNNTLIPYVALHLRAEEEFLLSINYLNFEEHKHHHDWVLKLFTEAGEKLRDKQSARQALSMLTGWLYSHVGKVDKKYGIFYREKQSL